ncbi:MAG: citrate transporter [Clostridiales bacterium]|nr:citrate transporter [Candidatus Scatonaster coprocaballi]
METAPQSWGNKCIQFFKKNAVMCIAALLAVLTSFFVPPDKAYLDYFDLRTLTCLFLTLLVICALKNIRFFSIVAHRIVVTTGNLRILALALCYITFIGSMLIANDMALITFLPLGYFALSVTKNEEKMAYIFILQNISANLGGMLTPFGNPQNLYLYSHFDIPTGEFMRIMFPPFMLAIAMLTIACMLLPRTKLEIRDDANQTLNKKRTTLYLILFACSLLIVFRVIDYRLGLILIPAVMIFADHKAFGEVDYGLLCTFALFFIFSGNMARIPAVQDFAEHLLQKNTMLVSIGSCQVISNVPSAILLSQFSMNYKELLLGVNIGGTGTLISSLASLITFSHYRTLHPGNTKKYLILFTVMNLVFLVVMTLMAQFFFR